MLKKLAVGAALLLVGAVFVIPVFAQPSVEMAVDVDNVSLVEGCTSDGGADPTQVWETALSVMVSNTSEDVAKFTNTGYFVKFGTPSSGPNQIGYDVAVVDSGGFDAGQEVGQQDSRTFHPIVRATMPCDATNADIFATLTLDGTRAKTYQDGATFLDGGTPVPLGPTGVLGIAIIVGFAGLVAQQLGRKPRASRAGVSTR